ncbi:calcium and integrin-binding family member 2-like [Hyalella azteca]|uniref:Calcium and integrin-binding family member 2-like n=1 Tax=Hyalella azteca TaxID=294128 RepID=A0A979FLI2_HYAAZ|nr:calcium and integrin-binding family member 2-like [Hyalella azteca]
MAGVLGHFMRHSKARQDIAKRREQIKAERQHLAASGVVLAGVFWFAGIWRRASVATKISAGEIGVTLHCLQCSVGAEQEWVRGHGPQRCPTHPLHQQYDLIVTLDLVNSELRKLVSGVSTCADGTIEFNEFLQMMSKKLKNMGDENELKEAFKVFDKKNSGYLTSTELRHVMTSLGERLSESEVDAMIKEASPSGDGKVNYDDFVSLIARKH